MCFFRSSMRERGQTTYTQREPRMADTLILTGTTSLELSAKGAGSDIRSWAKNQVGGQGAQLFINNIAEPGDVDTIINLHRGSVGIGTASPSAKLTVETAQAGPLVLVRNTSATGDGIRAEAVGSGHGLSAASFSHTGVAGASETGIGVHGLSSRGPGVSGESNSGPGLVGSTISGANVIEGRRLNQLVFAVTQSGAVLADGPYTGPADFAEMLPAAASASPYEPGEVLIIGPDGKLARSAEPNATNVAGVYSTRPGFLGDMRRAEAGLEPRAKEPADGGEWLPVALTGVVPVKASAENGAIRPGDLLTTSATPGYAMRATPVPLHGVEIFRAGTLLGRALEPLPAGKATIKVLLVL
jgi:hypothetical protein